MKRLTSIFLVLAMLLTLAPMNIFAAENDETAFSDMKTTDYYAKAATALEELEIISGYPDGTYGAEKSITRAEMAAIVCRIIDKETDAKKAKGETIFDDVASDYWASGYINIAVNEGIINGDGNGKFRPEDEVKYEEAIKMIVCALGYADNIETAPADWSKAYLDIADDKGITSDLKIKKGEPATRGDIAVMSYNGLATESENSKIPATPVASVKAGEYKETQKVKLSTVTKDSDIYYTTDGTTPTVKSNKYKKEISISKTSTLKAIAVKNGVVSKDVMSIDYTIKKVSSGGGGGGGSSRPSTPTYTVSFDLNYEGATGAPANQSIRSGNKATEPTAPERDGYSFVGWFKDQQMSKVFLFTETISSDITLYAKWLETDTRTFTRGEWIALLLTQVNAEVLENGNQTNYYGDTEGTEYSAEIEAAKAYGIIPADEDEQDVPLFNPDELATREFAAITAVLAMGFVSDNKVLDCTDKNELAYPELALIAVKEGFVVLEDNSFYPSRALSGTEKEQIFDVIDIINESAEITEEFEEVSYSNNVVSEELKSIQNYTVSYNDAGNYIVKVLENDSTKKIKENEYFVLPPNDEFSSGLALKALSIQKQDEYFVIESTVPEDISKVLSSVVFAGKATPDADNVELLDENISYTYDPEGTITDENTISTYGRIGGSFAVPGKWTFDFGEGVKIGQHAKLKGKTEVTIPDITAYLDADFGWFSVDVNELTVSITEKAKIDGKLEYVVIESEYAEGYSGAKEFARVPFALGTTGLSIDLVFSLYYDIKGSISIVYTVEATQGLQYKDDNFRFIHNFNNQLDIPKIEGSGQVGLQPAINLVFCEIWDIIGISGKIGAAATVSINNHVTENLCCIDGTVYMAASIGLNEDTLIGDFIKNKKHYTLEKEIYDSDNSPLKLKLHFENLQKVPECTYGDGKITGFVYDANTREPIRYARVSVYKGGDLKAVKYTNSEGKYEVSSGLPVGMVTIKISATGYKTYSDNRQVNKNVETYIESYMMVGRSDEVQGNVSGRFIDALTGNNIDGVTYELRSGWNNTTGDVILSASSEGTYNFDILAGNYTILAKAEDYISNSTNITITGNACVQADVTLSPEESEIVDTNNNLRFVLTWGETPRDLDSHLFGPATTGNGTFHTYYSSKDYYHNNERIANLDLDDTTSYGPETTTIYKMNSSGKYSFYVHDFSNRSSDSSTSMSKSGAKVVIYNGNTLYATFNIPVNVGGTVWHVFDYDAQTGVITPVNTMSYSSNPGNLGLYSLRENDFSERDAIDMIRESTIDDK